MTFLSEDILEYLINLWTYFWKIPQNKPTWEEHEKTQHRQLVTQARVQILALWATHATCWGTAPPPIHVHAKSVKRGLTA